MSERSDATATYRDRRIDDLHVPLLNQDLACLQTQLFDLLLRDWLASCELLNLSIWSVSDKQAQRTR